MKAVVLFGNEDIRYVDWEEPVTQAGTVKIKIAACGICGSDIPRVFENAAHSYPVILGHEFAGSVVEIGDNVTSLQVGDHVVGVPLLPCHKCEDCRKGNYSLCRYYSFIGSRQQGAFADYVIAPESNAVKINPTIPLDQAALIEPATVAIHGLRQSDYRGGGYVAILGSGTIGLFTMQWAKIFGAKKVIVVNRGEERLEIAKRLGADSVFSMLQPDFIQDALALTRNRGFDYIFETAGSAETSYLAFELAANKAHICFIGTPNCELTYPSNLWELMNRKEFIMTGSWMSYSSPFPGDEWSLTSHYFSTGQLKFDENLIFKRFPMKDADKAFELYKNPNQVKGRVLLINE